MYGKQERKTISPGNFHLLLTIKTRAYNSENLKLEENENKQSDNNKKS